MFRVLLTTFSSSRWHDKARQVVPSIAPLWGSPAYSPKPPILETPMKQGGTLDHEHLGRVMLNIKNKAFVWSNRKQHNYMGKMFDLKPTKLVQPGPKKAYPLCSQLRSLSTPYISPKPPLSVPLLLHRPSLPPALNANPYSLSS